MKQTFKLTPDFLYNKKLLLFGIALLVSLTVFQDYMESQRYGFPFVLSESLLFKMFWVMFFPVLLLLRRILKNNSLSTPVQTCLAIMLPVLIHLTCLPFLVWGLSVVLFDHTYDYFKVFTFTLTNDLYPLLLIYATYVLLHRYFISKQNTELNESLQKPVGSQQTLVVRHGKINTTLKVNDIYYIKSESPYVAIHLEGKEYLHNETLKSITQRLDPGQFVRVHKSSVVNVNKVASYKSRFNGDYDLTLHNGIELRLSRNYLSNFKEHLIKASSG